MPDPAAPTPAGPGLDGLAIELFVTPVIGGTRAMRWTSPYSGTCFTLYENGVYTVTRRVHETRETPVTGRLETAFTNRYLDAPISMEARRAAAVLVLDVDALPLPEPIEDPDDGFFTRPALRSVPDLGTGGLSAAG